MASAEVLWELETVPGVEIWVFLAAPPKADPLRQPVKYKGTFPMSSILQTAHPRGVEHDRDEF